MTVAVGDNTVMEPLMTDATDTDKKVGDGQILHHHRVGMGHAESTPAETALPVRLSDVKKRVAEPGAPSKATASARAEWGSSLGTVRDQDRELN